MKKCILITLLIISSCSSKTLYNINIDLLSFISDNELKQSIVFPPSMELNIYIFPEVDIDLTNSGPGASVQQGFLISVPSQEIDNLNKISLKLQIEIEVTNNSTTDQITGDRISLYFAPESVENIYDEGTKIDLIDVGIIAPQESTSFTQEYALEENEPLLEILRTGTMRVGMGIFLTASTSFLPAEYKLIKISLYSGFTPVEIILLAN